MSGMEMIGMNELSARAKMISCLAIAGAFLVACAGPNKMVERAELTAQGARNDQDIQRYAPVALDRTEEELQRLKAAQADGGSQAEIEHLAYLVERRAAVAGMRATTVSNRVRVDELGSRRQQILIDAESLEAELARQEAASAIRDAQVAKQRADALEQELNDLEAKQTDRGLLVTIGDVLFDVDGAKLKPGGLEQISRIASILQSDPNRSVMIEGHTDSTGAESYNLQLSEDRANAVKAALIDDGVSQEQISARGYGEAYPVATNENQSGRQQNRRVELIIQEG